MAMKRETRSMLCLLNAFIRPATISPAGIQLSNRAELMQDLLNYGFSNPSTAISLKDLSKTMLKSSSSIAKASREQFGVFPDPIAQTDSASAGAKSADRS